MATIEHQRIDNNVSIKKDIVWEGVTETDTFGEASINSGRYMVEVKGHFGDSAVVDIELGMTSGSLAAIDTDNAPSGLRFSEQNMAIFDTGDGYVQPVLQTVGNSLQDLDVTIRYMGPST